MPDYSATLGVTVDAYFTISFAAADEISAIDRVIAAAGSHHDTRRLTLVDQSERGWRIDDLMLVGGKGRPDWDNGLVCEDIPLDRTALALPWLALAPQLLALIGKLLLGRPADREPWWDRLDETTTAMVVHVLSQLTPGQTLPRETILDTIEATLERVERTPEVPSALLLTA